MFTLSYLHKKKEGYVSQIKFPIAIRLSTTAIERTEVSPKAGLTSVATENSLSLLHCLFCKVTVEETAENPPRAMESRTWCSGKLDFTSSHLL